MRDMKEMTLVFYNHYHRGDLFTHKEFVRQVKKELYWPRFEYWHYNHPKVNADLDIPVTRGPYNVNNTTKFFEENNPESKKVGVNTWIGCYGEIFTRCGGVNLQSLTESWTGIFDHINAQFGSELRIKENIAEYLPTIDFTYYDVSEVDNFLKGKKDRKRVLICNGVPMSNQSFNSDMSDIIIPLSFKYPDIDFICTKKFAFTSKNIYFTDDITKDKSDYNIKVPWNDRSKNNCDLNEISYLSRFCDAIIGKNSGPFVFCETYNNLMDPYKIILSFSRGPKESMSNGIDKKCDYRLVTDHTPVSISEAVLDVCESVIK